MNSLSHDSEKMLWGESVTEIIYIYICPYIIYSSFSELSNIVSVATSNGVENRNRYERSNINHHLGAVRQRTAQKGRKFELQVLFWPAGTRLCVRGCIQAQEGYAKWDIYRIRYFWLNKQLSKWLQHGF